MSKYIDNGHPDKFPEPEDGWAKQDNNWYDNGQPAPNLKPDII